MSRHCRKALPLNYRRALPFYYSTALTTHIRQRYPCKYMTVGAYLSESAAVLVQESMSKKLMWRHATFLRLAAVLISVFPFIPAPFP